MTDLEMYEHETDAFTSAEMQAIADYEEAVNGSGLSDCFSGLDVRHIRWHESQFGQEDTQAMLREHGKMLHTWYLAVDSLLGNILTCTSEFSRYSVAASRYVKEAAGRYHRARQEFEHAVTVWSLALLTNDANEEYPPPTCTVNMAMQTLTTEE